jgi:CRP-like cAMP-binding protein
VLEDMTTTPPVPESLDSLAASLISVYMDSLSQYHKIFLHRTLATWRNLTVDTAHKNMKRAFQTWSFFLRAQYRAEKLKMDEKNSSELREHALSALAKPCHQRSPLDITRICAWFKQSKLFGKKKIPAASLLIIAKEAAVWSGPANKAVFFQGMRGDGTGPGQKDAWWQWGYYVLLSGKINLYSFSDKAQEAHALSRFVLAGSAPRSPGGNFSSTSRRDSLGQSGGVNWSQDDEDKDGLSDVLSQSASGRSVTSGSGQWGVDTAGQLAALKNFDPPKSELGVPEMAQLASPKSSRVVSDIIDEAIPPSPVPRNAKYSSPLTFEPLSPSFNASSYTTLFARKENPSTGYKSPSSPGFKRSPSFGAVNALEEPMSPGSGVSAVGGPLRRQGSRGDTIPEAPPSSNSPAQVTPTVNRRKSQRGSFRGGDGGSGGGSGRELIRRDSLGAGILSPKEPPSGGSFGTPNGFKRSNSLTSPGSPDGKPPLSGAERGYTRKNSSTMRGKTPERTHSHGLLDRTHSSGHGLVSKASTQSMTQSRRRTANREHSGKEDSGAMNPNASSKNLLSEPVSAAMSATSAAPENGIEGSKESAEPEQEVDFLNSGILGDLIFSSSTFGHSFGEIALTDKQNPVRTTAAVLAEPSMLLVIGPDAFARAMQSEVVGVMNMRKKLAFLEKPRGLFGRWRNAQLAQLSYVMSLKTYLPRDVIHEQGENMTSLMFVKSGLVKSTVSLIGDSGKAEKFIVDVGRLGEGSMIDDVALIEGGGKYSATFIAESVVEVLSIKLNDFEKVITNGIGQAKTTAKDIKAIAEARKEIRLTKVLDAKQKFLEANSEKDNSTKSKKNQANRSRHPFRSPAYDMAWSQAIDRHHQHNKKKHHRQQRDPSSSEGDGMEESLSENSVLKFTKVKGVLPADHLPTASAFSLLQVINEPLPAI